jgi:hypothetical protein
MINLRSYICNVITSKRVAKIPVTFPEITVGRIPESEGNRHEI